jgi:hypothetical protein
MLGHLGDDGPPHRYRYSQQVSLVTGPVPGTGSNACHCVTGGTATGMCKHHAMIMASMGETGTGTVFSIAQCSSLIIFSQPVASQPLQSKLLQCVALPKHPPLRNLPPKSPHGRASSCHVPPDSSYRTERLNRAPSNSPRMPTICCLKVQRRA